MQAKKSKGILDHLLKILLLEVSKEFFTYKKKQMYKETEI